MTDITPTLSDYPYTVVLPTRWQDNDIYGRINNAAYYGYFDTAVTRFLIEEAGLELNGNIVAYMVSSQCQYISPMAFPENASVGIRVIKLGRSSVTYGVSIYAGEGDSQRRVAHGQFVHVFVNAVSDAAVPIPKLMREALTKIKETL
jgi:acyl-CoA thioester hydrolase